MTIRKGIIRNEVDGGSGETVVSICTVIEKTEGNYTEHLFRRDSWEVIAGGNVVTFEYRNEFKVYHGNTIEEMMLDNGITGAYTWDTPLAEV